MARIVAVHGVGQQFKGEHILAAEWLPAICDGLARAGRGPLADTELECAFYGDLFRPRGKAVTDRNYRASDVDPTFELELLQAWWQEVTSADAAVPPPDAMTKTPAVGIAQRALNALSKARFFAGLAEKALVGDLKQVHLYFADVSLRAAAGARAALAIGPQTKVVIGHSLGSVVAYEALCSLPAEPACAFITIGSPLGIRNLIFDRLQPAPADEIGVVPARVCSWTNIADRGDVVALAKELRPFFGPAVQDIRVNNGAQAHNARPYLTSVEVGRAIAEALDK